MPRFFDAEIGNGRAVIRGEDAEHIARSLRMREGESLVLCADGRDYHGVIESVDAREVRLRILSEAPALSEPDVRITLFQCVPKGDKLERIVKQTVELGVCEVVPVVSSRCVSRPDGKSAGAKRERLQKIALEAAKQSGRGIIPEVGGFHSFAETLLRFPAFDTVLFFYEMGGEPLRTLLSSSRGMRSIALLIGSEGGFSPEEAEQIQTAGALTATLGPRILRAETAPVAAMTALMLLTGNLD